MKTFNIAGIELKNRYVLAPLAGFTDYSLRRLASEYGAGLTYTEMESCESLLYNSKETIEDLKNTHLDKKYCPTTKLALQIFGGKAENILKSIPMVEKYADYDFLDFNVGCPVPKVIRQSAGSYWLNREDELLELLKNMVRISSKPVIVKIRIGFEKIMDVKHLVKEIEKCGVNAIAIHGRTRAEGFSGPVHYDIIKECVHAVSIPIIANGSIDENNFLDVFNMTDCQAVMIGQRAIGYPKVFHDMIDREEGKEITKTTLFNQINDLKKHLDYIFSIKPEIVASRIMRGISTNYLKNFNNMKEYKRRLVLSNSKADYLQILDELIKNIN